jgi:hypothetical protein
MAVPSDEFEAPCGFDYFVVRVTRTAGPATRVSGLIERLGSGEKHWFYSGEQLTHLMALWSREREEEETQS